MKENKNKTILDLGMKLRVAYNHDRQFLEKLVAYKEYVDSVYVAPNIRIFPVSGAFVSPHIKWDAYDEEISFVAEFLKKHGIKTYLLLNATRFAPDTLKSYKKSPLRGYLKKMTEVSGLNKFVISSLPLAIQVKTDLGDAGIEVSTTAGVDCLEKLRMWMEYVDVEGVCVHQRLNKKINLLKEIKEKTKLKLSVIVNNPCLVDCPNEISHNNFVTYPGCERTYFDCSAVLAANPWKIFHQAKIVPANLKYYKGILDIVKIEGRSETTEKLIQLVHEYALNLDSCDYPSTGFGNREFPFFHPYYQRKEPPGVFEKVSKCDNKCDECGYCYKIWKEYYRLGDSIDYCVEAYKSIAKKEYSKAFEYFEKYLKSAISGEATQDVFFQIGICCQEMNKEEKAIEYFLKSIQAGGKNRYEIYSKLGLCYLKASKNKEAIESFSLALKEIPLGESPSPVYFYMGLSHINLKQYDKAIASLNNAEKEAADTKKGRIYYNLGICYFSKDSFADALKYYQKAMAAAKADEDITGGIYFNLGVCYFKTGEYKKAVLNLERARGAGPAVTDDASLEFYLGLCYSILGEYGKAVEVFEGAVKHGAGTGDSGMIKYHLGMCYKALGRHNEAIKALNEAYSESQNEKDRGEIKAQIGLSELELGNSYVAKETLKEAAGHKPDRGECYNLLGMIYMEDGEHDKAINILNEGIKNAPNDWANYNLLGVLYRAKGRMEEAINMLKKAIELEPGEWRNYNILGNIYRKQGETVPAVEMYKTALGLCHDHEYRKKIAAAIDELKSVK